MAEPFIRIILFTSITTDLLQILLLKLHHKSDYKKYFNLLKYHL